MPYAGVPGLALPIELKTMRCMDGCAQSHQWTARPGETSSPLFFYRHVAYKHLFWTLYISEVELASFEYLGNAIHSVQVI